MYLQGVWVHLLLALCVVGWPLAAALNDGQALRPPMGYNTWNAFGAEIDEKLVRRTANRIVELGLRDAGYRYLVLDDGWSDPERGPDGRLRADTQRFPSGMPALAAYLQARGLELGIYSDSGHFTCQGFPGSRDHEQLDAQTFADWGVGLLKYDNCFVHDDLLPRFVAMCDALNATGRPILFSLCEWGIGDPWLWGPQVAHSWRTTFDIHPNWPSLLQNLDESVGLARYAGPGSWNDLDLLEVGPTGWPNGRSYLSPKEERAHFALWALLKSPLFVAADLRQLSPASLATLTAREVIALNQDPLGVPGDLVWKQGPKEVYATPLADGGRGVVLFNRHSVLSQFQASNITLCWPLLGYSVNTSVAVRDLYDGKEMGLATGSLTAEVPVHGVLVLRLTPLHPEPWHTLWRPWHAQPMFDRHPEDESWIPSEYTGSTQTQALPQPLPRRRQLN